MSLLSVLAECIEIYEKCGLQTSISKRRPKGNKEHRIKAYKSVTPDPLANIRVPSFGESNDILIADKNPILVASPYIPASPIKFRIRKSKSKCN